MTEHYDDLANDFMFFSLSQHYHNGTYENITQLFKLPIAEAAEIDNVKILKRSRMIYLDQSVFESLHLNTSFLKVDLLTNIEASLPVNFSFDPSPLDKEVGIILAAMILMGLYVLIIWELVHRTFAAIVASTLAIGKCFDFN